jgi:signal transduction histidine kinase
VLPGQRSLITTGITSRAIVQCVPQAILLLDRQFRITQANRAAALLFSTSADALVGRPFTSLVPGEQLAGLFGDFEKHPTRVIETSLPAAATGQKPVTVRITALLLTRWAATPDGRRATDQRPHRREFTLLILEDISEKAALEQHLLEREKQIAMGQLAAGILHELNNPLAAIGSNLLFARSTLNGTANPDVIQALELSLEQLEHMRQLLGTLSGVPSRFAPCYERADVQDVVRRSVAFIAREAERRRVQLLLSLTPPGLQCEMDVRMIKQVLLNLLKNAMEAMPDGGRLEVRSAYREACDEIPAAVVITIADTGVGIPEADVRKVFRPLFTTKPRGAGLGLSFCRQAVEEHGGEIRLANRAKEPGTVATVLLPVRQAGCDCDY